MTEPGKGGGLGGGAGGGLGGYCRFVHSAWMKWRRLQLKAKFESGLSHIRFKR